MALFKTKQYFNTAILTFFCRILLEDPSRYACTSAKLFKLHHIWFKVESKAAPVCDEREILEHQQGSCRTCLSPQTAARRISTQKADDIIFPLKILQNPHSHHVLRILSDLPKLNLCSSSPLTVTAASAAF